MVRIHSGVPLDKPNLLGLSSLLGSFKSGGIRFTAYSNDHVPRHVHGFYEDVVVIVDLLEDGVALADRKDIIRPRDAKRSTVRKILDAAAENFFELVKLWEEIHDDN